VPEERRCGCHSKLRGAGHHLTIETAGTCLLDVQCDLMSISPKLASSTPSVELAGPWSARHESSRHAPAIIRALVARYPYQIKFVIDRKGDCAEVHRYLAEFPEIDKRRVLLMPQGTDVQMLAERSAWLEPYCRDHGLRFCPRRQIEWFGLARGT
jgi:7-carboxy-7-deazaguanine synthase